MGRVRATPVALVTGAGRGIGRAIADGFAAAGWAVALAEARPALGRRAARALAAGGARALFVPTDVSDAASVARTVRVVRRRLGGLDCVVNNAGVLDVGPLHRLPLAALDRMVAVNLRGPLVVTRAVLPALRARRRGSIVNVASLLGKTGIGDYVTYCATKFGVVGLTQALADELAGTGIRVWAVCPGLTDTPMARRAVGVTGEARRGLLPPSAVARVVVALATGRRRAPSGAALDVS
jgi:NAD(P)-dependent dehydrogenase (short-subunit alcohol dehydrogenase family)